MTQALTMEKHHNSNHKEGMATKPLSTEQPIKVGITVEKTVLLVEAKTVVNSVNLEVGKTYYAEVCGKAHYYISLFPSGKLSHMGVYQKAYFKVISDEIVTYEPRLHELKQLRREGKLNQLQLQQLADFENGAEIASVPALVKSESSVVAVHNEATPTERLIAEDFREEISDKEELHPELTGKVKALLDNALLPEQEREVRLQQQAHEQSRPDDDAYPHDLLHERVYSAELVWCKAGYRAEMFVGSRLFIQRISKDNPYYKESDCSVFTDQECKEPLAGRLKLAWFTDFQLIKDEEEGILLNKEPELPVSAEVETIVTSPTEVAAEEEQAAIEIQVVEETAKVDVTENQFESKEDEEAPLEVEQLSLFF